MIHANEPYLAGSEGTPLVVIPGDHIPTLDDTGKILIRWLTPGIYELGQEVPALKVTPWIVDQLPTADEPLTQRKTIQDLLKDIPLTKLGGDAVSEITYRRWMYGDPE